MPGRGRCGESRSRPPGPRSAGRRCSQERCRHAPAGEGNLTRSGRGPVGSTRSCSGIVSIAGSRRAAPEAPAQAGVDGALRRWKGALDRDAPPSLTRGAGAAVLAPGRVVRKDDRHRARQSVSEADPSPLERPKTPSQTARRSKLRSRSTVPSGARPSLRRGLRARLTEAEGAPSSASSLLSPERGSRTKPRVLVVQVGLQRSRRRIVVVIAEGSRKASRRRRAIARWFGPAPC